MLFIAHRLLVRLAIEVVHKGALALLSSIPRSLVIWRPDMTLQGFA